MPRSCHLFFGMRDMKRVMTGPEYAKKPTSFPKFTQGCSVQLDRSLHRPVLEAGSRGRVIWRKKYRSLLANHRITIPLWEFDFSRVDRKEGVRLSIR